jgi:hypothetical protein
LGLNIVARFDFSRLVESPLSVYLDRASCREG